MQKCTIFFNQLVPSMVLVSGSPVVVLFIRYVSVYNPFSDGVGLPLHNIPSPGVLMKSMEQISL